MRISSVQYQVSWWRWFNHAFLSHLSEPQSTKSVMQIKSFSKMLTFLDGTTENNFICCSTFPKPHVVLWGWYFWPLKKIERFGSCAQVHTWAFDIILGKKRKKKRKAKQTSRANNKTPKLAVGVSTKQQGVTIKSDSVLTVLFSNKSSPQFTNPLFNFLPHWRFVFKWCFSSGCSHFEYMRLRRRQTESLHDKLLGHFLLVVDPPL